MLNITIMTVGKIKEKYFREAIEEYKKRLSRYCRLNIIEVKDEPTPDNPSDREKEAVLEKEGARIEEKLPKNAYIVALCIEGKMQTSEELADFLQKTATEGYSDIAFIIGGSMGLWEEIKKRADLRISFSKMTFPHQLMRVILLEQIYRGFNISEGGKYHK
ncbi:MAG: 23S rRNA (pseudouridine(1915)-N(3))-methyltransferase RlmH [Clostridia bacterium]|nr:23S rRNA (pseudouridine(1915)-N(3))-methyltransferase RlmH [Clostridia bacterium]